MWSESKRFKNNKFYDKIVALRFICICCLLMKYSLNVIIILAFALLLKNVQPSEY